MSAMMAPLVIPTRSCETNCPGSLTAWTSSSTKSVAMIATAMRDCQLEDLTPSSRVAPLGFASCVVAIRIPLLDRGTREKASGSPAVHPNLRPTILRNVDGPVELELAVLDPLAGELGEGGVAILIEAPSAEHAIVVPSCE